MTEVHRVLVVEDDVATAEDLEIVLDALGFAHEVVDNQEDALERFQSSEFCLVLLDLSIKLKAESLKAHAEAGRELLRRMRAISPKHAPVGGPSVPIVIVSGHAKEADEAVEAMRDGADDVIQKPITKSRQLSDRVRRALEASGRGRHELCAPRPRRLLEVPAEQKKRRFSVRIAGADVWLTSRSLELLLHLIEGKLRGGGLHKRELGWDQDQGFQAMTRLREQLGAPCGIPADEFVVNLHHGYYELAADVEIGACELPRLRAIGGNIARLATSVEALLRAGSSTGA